MLGQVVYHLLAAAHAARAPWPVVVLVACLPVVTLGFGAGLTHLLRVPDVDEPAAPAPDVDERQGAEPVADELPAVPVVDEPPAIGPGAAPGAIVVPVPTSAEHAAELAVRATHAAGNVLSARAVERQFGLSRNTATKLHRRVLKELIGEQEPELDEAQRRVRAWDESKRVNDAEEAAADLAPELSPA
jgi:hypothetical protein